MYSYFFLKASKKNLTAHSDYAPIIKLALLHRVIADRRWWRRRRWWWWWWWYRKSINKLFHNNRKNEKILRFFFALLWTSWELFWYKKNVKTFSKLCTLKTVCETVLRLFWTIWAEKLMLSIIAIRRACMHMIQQLNMNVKILLSINGLTSNDKIVSNAYIESEIIPQTRFFLSLSNACMWWIIERINFLRKKCGGVWCEKARFDLLKADWISLKPWTASWQSVWNQ